MGEHRLDGPRGIRALAVCAATTGAMAAGLLGQTPQADATCLSVSGVDLGSGCHSAPFSLALGVGPGARARASQPFTFAFGRGSGFAKPSRGGDVLTFLRDALGNAVKTLSPHPAKGGAHAAVTCPRADEEAFTFDVYKIKHDLDEATVLHAKAQDELAASNVVNAKAHGELFALAPGDPRRSEKQNAADRTELKVFLASDKTSETGRRITVLRENLEAAMRVAEQAAKGVPVTDGDVVTRKGTLDGAQSSLVMLEASRKKVLNDLTAARDEFDALSPSDPTWPQVKAKVQALRKAEIDGRPGLVTAQIAAFAAGAEYHAAKRAVQASKGGVSGDQEVAEVRDVVAKVQASERRPVSRSERSAGVDEPTPTITGARQVRGERANRHAENESSSEAGGRDAAEERNRAVPRPTGERRDTGTSRFSVVAGAPPAPADTTSSRSIGKAPRTSAGEH